MSKHCVAILFWFCGTSVVFAQLAISPPTLPDGAVNVPYGQSLSANGCGQCVWSSTGTLPAGVNLDSSSGQLSGTPTTAGSYQFTAIVTDANLNSASQPYTVVIHPAPVITTTSLPPGTAGTAYSQAVSASSGSPPYQFSVTSGALPPGLALDPSSGTIGGTPTAAGSSSFAITVTDSFGATASQSFTLSVAAAIPPLSISTPSPLTGGTVGVAYSQSLSAAGGTPPYSWSVTAGSLPAGLSLTASTGSVTGTPTTAGASTFTIQVADSAQAHATVQFSLTISPPPLRFTITKLPGGTVGVSYSQLIAVTGGTPPYIWTLMTGSLPPGLTFNGSNGQLTGIPSEVGSSSFGIQVTDSKSAQATANFTIAVVAPPLSITNTSLPSGQVGTPYSVTLAGTGGTPPYTWAITSGALPGGVSLNAASGLISGSPTAPGNFSFTVRLSDSAGGTPASAHFAVTIAPPKLVITSTSPFPDGVVGAGYRVVLSATGGVPPYTWSMTSGALPDGLSLNGSTGNISGVPGSAGRSVFTMQVSDSANAQTSAQFSITVDPPALTLDSRSLPGGTSGVPYSQTLSASGGSPPYGWSLDSGALPNGLTLNPASGAITGTPDAVGTFSFTARVTDANGTSATAPLSIVIAAPKLIISTASKLPDGTSGVGYSQMLAASGGIPPYSWSVISGSLPSGLTLSPDGVVAGTPAAAGTFAFTAQVADSANTHATAQFSLVVRPPTLQITSAPALPAGTIGVAYSLTLAASGGTPPYAWSSTAGVLPNGLTLAAPSGILSGTPAALGSFTFNLRVTDSAGATADALETILISAQPPPPPTVALSQIPATANSSTQIPIDLVLSASYSQPVTGQITLTFQPDAAAPQDDPAIQFSNGSRTANFTVAPGKIQAAFGGAALALQTGSIAGAIHLAVTTNLPNANFNATVTVARAAPVISSASVIRGTSNFQIRISGFSNSRDLTTAQFHFTPVSGQVLQTGDLTVDLKTAAAQWYGATTSAPFGGQFLVVVPFNIDAGSVGNLSSVSVKLQNAQGSSAAANANF